MTDRLLNWLLTIPQILAQFTNWIIQPLPVINLSPLALISVGGIGLLIAWHLTRLIIGG